MIPINQDFHILMVMETFIVQFQIIAERNKSSPRQQTENNSISPYGCSPYLCHIVSSRGSMLFIPKWKGDLGTTISQKPA